MVRPVVLLSIPGLREKDVGAMPRLRELTAGGEILELVPSFPCVTCPVQAAMTTGRTPREHGVVANGFYWRERRHVEMWTSSNDCVQRPQIWDFLAQHDESLRSAVWFPLHSKHCTADYVCTPSPIHHPDGKEELWCYTRPTELYGTLRDRLGHFPLKHFWGPLANIASTNWIVDSAIAAAETYRPSFYYIYLPHLDYAAQRSGPDTPPAAQAVQELDAALARLAAGLNAAHPGGCLWLAAGEYAITPVDHVTYPNRILREAGLLEVRTEADGEHLDLERSRAFAMVDHQLSHIFVADSDPATVERVAALFRGREGIDDMLCGIRRGQYGLDHPRSGDVILISAPSSWQAYYWWLADSAAPAYARTVDIHRKPGYDPVELCFDPATRSIPLDATRIRGSHGAPAHNAAQRTVLVASEPCLLPYSSLCDHDLFHLVLRHYGVDLRG